MIGLKYSVVFIQLLLSAVSAAPVSSEVATEMAQTQEASNSIFSQASSEKLDAKKVDAAASTEETVAESTDKAVTVSAETEAAELAAAPLANNLEMKQNLDCGGCCNECGGCPTQNTCVCPCDILKALPRPCDLLKAVPCPCDLLKGACVCGANSKQSTHCSECGQQQCVCHEKPHHQEQHCNQCGQGQQHCECPQLPCAKPCFKPCCIKPPCPCEIGKCLCAHKPECPQCGQSDCCC